jgi:hypothetical protein
MRLIFTLLILFCAEFLPAQNLLLNPSFEDTVQLKFGRTFARDWSSPNLSSPEHYNPFSRVEWRVPQNIIGYQVANTGSSYFGVLIYSLKGSQGIRSARDYLQTKIIDTLVKDSVYCFQLFLSLADSCNYASRNQLGVKFSDAKLISNTTDNFNEIPDIIISPTDYIIIKDKWLQYDFTYLASGGEQYLTLGNFKDTSAVDTIRITGGSQEWQYATYYYIDDIYLGSCDSLPFDTNVGLQEQNLIQRNHNLFPNPASNRVNLAFEVKPNEHFSFMLYDLQGRLVREQQLHAGKEHQIPLELINKGLYLYQIRNEKGEFLSGKLVVE